MAIARLDQLNNYAMLTMLALILISGLPQSQVGNPYVSLPNGVGSNELFSIDPRYFKIETGRQGSMITDSVANLYNWVGIATVKSPFYAINEGETGYIDFVGAYSAANVQCWVSFGFRSLNATHSNFSRWIMAESNNVYTGSVLGGQYPKVFTYVIRIDDENSERSIAPTLCPGQVLVRWGGSFADSYNKTGQILTAMAALSTAQKYSNGTFYMCVDPSPADITNKTYVENGVNITSRYFNMMTNVVCARSTLKSYIPGISIGSPSNFVQLEEYRSPPNSTMNNSYILVVNLLAKEEIAVKTFNTAASDYIIGALKSMLNTLNSYLVGAIDYLPEPFPTIFRTVSMIVDFIIVAVSFFLCYQLVKYFLNFRSALKTSLLKAAIVGIEVFLILFILIGAFYVLTHPVPYCGVKLGTTMLVFKQLGLEIKTPQSIWDAPTLVWDLAYLGVVQKISNDCVNQFILNKNVKLTDLTNYQEAPPYPLICDENNLKLGEPGCQSIYVRAAEIIILTVIILVIIGIMWTMIMYLYKKVKTMEYEVRDDDTSYIDKGEEDND